MKTLNTIQKLSKIGKVISKIVFIACLIGIIGCVVGFVGLMMAPGNIELGNVTIP